MRYMILILTLVFSASALGSNCHYRSVRVDRQMIAVGDAPRKAHEAGPDREVQLENRYGAAAGYRLDFYERGKTVEIHVRGGEVVRICQRSD